MQIGNYLRKCFREMAIDSRQWLGSFNVYVHNIVVNWSCIRGPLLQWSFGKLRNIYLRNTMTYLVWYHDENSLNFISYHSHVVNILIADRGVYRFVYKVADATMCEHRRRSYVFYLSYTVGSLQLDKCIFKYAKPIFQFICPLLLFNILFLNE